VFSGVENSSTPGFIDENNADLQQQQQQQQQQQIYARFPLSRPMSPPVRSKYVTSPPPRANSTPPAAHHHHFNYNQQQLQQRQIEDYEYNQILMGMNHTSLNEKVCL
jgi:hypothetical protein